jgi:nucleoside-diphosphate-sugar epimerase
MNKAAQPKIYVAGHRSIGGSVRNLLAQGIASESLITGSRQELDLTNQLAVQEFFARERPDQVYLAAANVTITETAELIGEVVGIKDNIAYDTTKPDGAPRKWMDSQKLQSLDWKSCFTLKDGLQKAYADFLETPSVRNV